MDGNTSDIDHAVDEITSEFNQYSIGDFFGLKVGKLGKYFLK